MISNTYLKQREKLHARYYRYIIDKILRRLKEVTVDVKQNDINYGTCTIIMKVREPIFVTFLLLKYVAWNFVLVNSIIFT